MKTGVFILFSLLALLHFSCPKTSRSELPSEADFVKIEGGCFQMGDQFGDGLPDELPVHRVCLSDFYLSKYEVTQAQWQSVMGNNPSHDQGNSNYPVDVVSWHEVELFITRLNGKTDGKFRLPTEAEWEYGCRGGDTQFKYGTADGTSSAHSLSHSENEQENLGVMPVGSYPANVLGLHDMSGNVSEWVQDWYDRKFYAKSPVADPGLLEAPTKRSRVRRGGYWGDKEWVMRCTFRNHRKPNYRLIGLGFRLARDP